MLINKGIKLDIGVIASFKLINGEELLGKVENNISGYVISKPMIATLTPRGVATLPALLCGTDDATIDLKLSDIMYQGVCNGEMAQSYRQATSSIALVAPGTSLA